MAYCLCGLWACCCECLQDVVHSCPICQAPTIVHVSQPTSASDITVSQVVLFGRKPVNVICPTCRVQVTTLIRHEVNCLA
ncbi:hypothetical protein EB796_015499 [Bugula neritina]|uniref:LITAF n=1 Tax=Bugula neritina TaxID=10212 RepID=A0A7J7JK62_BUGNE|nr:hypothetical protein EB796_015499 [Bugula neritina]